MSLYKNHYHLWGQLGSVTKPNHRVLNRKRVLQTIDQRVHLVQQSLEQIFSANGRLKNIMGVVCLYKGLKKAQNSCINPLKLGQAGSQRFPACTRNEHTGTMAAVVERARAQLPLLGKLLCGKLRQTCAKLAYFKCFVSNSPTCDHY